MEEPCKRKNRRWCFNRLCIRCLLAVFPVCRLSLTCRGVKRQFQPLHGGVSYQNINICIVLMWIHIFWVIHPLYFQFDDCIHRQQRYIHMAWLRVGSSHVLFCHNQVSLIITIALTQGPSVFTPLFFKCGKDIDRPKFLDESNYGSSASSNMFIIEHLMSW